MKTTDTDVTTKIIVIDEFGQEYETSLLPLCLKPRSRCLIEFNHCCNGDIFVQNFKEDFTGCSASIEFEMGGCQIIMVIKPCYDNGGFVNGAFDCDSTIYGGNITQVGLCVDRFQTMFSMTPKHVQLRS